MASGDRTLRIDGTTIREGTALYDTAYEHPLWITNITASGVTVEPLTAYEVTPTGGPATQRTHIAEGTVFSTHEFKALVREDRFEISPR